MENRCLLPMARKYRSADSLTTAVRSLEAKGSDLFVCGEALDEIPFGINPHGLDPVAQDGCSLSPPDHRHDFPVFIVPGSEEIDVVGLRQKGDHPCGPDAITPNLAGILFFNGGI